MEQEIREKSEREGYMRVEREGRKVMKDWQKTKQEIKERLAGEIHDRVKRKREEKMLMKEPVTD